MFNKNQTYNSFLKGELGCIKGVPFEAFLYMLLNQKNPICVFLDRSHLEEVAVIFQERIGIDVCCIFEKNRETLPGFVDFYEQLSAISVQRLALDQKGLSFCFVDKKIIGVPIVPEKEKTLLKIDKKTSFEEFVGALSLMEYKKKEGVLRPGEFLVNGGLIDVVLFHSKRLFRISFLEEECGLFSVDIETNKILHKIKNLTLYPFLQKNKRSVDEALPGFYQRLVFNKNSVEHKTKPNKKTKELKILSVDYQCFIKEYKKGGHIFDLPLFVERGFVFGGAVCVPGWFLDGKQKERKEQKEPLNLGRLYQGGIYIHDDFGFCRYVGLLQTKSQEKVCLEFSDGRVHLDVYYLSKLSFYSIAQTKPLSSLNKTGLWKRKRRGVRSQASDFVKTLIESYSKRDVAAKSPYIVNDDLISEFIGGFKYTDTQDQALCWKELLLDLASSQPMNRLICGDVGFGKTELAIRAAFVTVYNGDQVVVLAPTTILANQLFHCFLNRVSSFGVSVGLLSRIVSNKKGVVDLFLNKKIDVLVGTSALLFNPLLLEACGLFIVDEEHRFGVKDKERVFEYNPGVNFLSMSATPIPRSLQLSLSNIRNFSIIKSPPISRKPIISSAGVFSKELIKKIILKEVGRDGQVYFVDNSVDSLRGFYSYLSGSLPGVSFGFVYGSLSPAKLLQTMEDFINKKTQVLLSTTIIESGIDIGSTNSIVINNAHLFGLSQLYQLRGRVGRSGIQAFAWFLIPKKHSLSPEGIKRLKAIVKYSALGVGYQVSLADLDLRGSGSLFGYQQSGDGGVGFEYYTKLLSLAIIKLKIKKDFTGDCFVDLLNKPIPSSFIANADERAYYYKAIFSAPSKKELLKIKQDVVDLFGFCCPEVDVLFKSRELALKASIKHINKIVKKEEIITVSFDYKKAFPLIGDLLGFIENFFVSQSLDFWFVNSHKNIIFKYKNKTKDDYILLSSFLKKLTLFK